MRVPEHVLIEDEALVAMTAEAMQTQLGCAIVTVSADIAAAREVLADTANALDLALLDVNMRHEYVYPPAAQLDRRGVPVRLRHRQRRRGGAQPVRRPTVLTQAVSLRRVEAPVAVFCRGLARLCAPMPLVKRPRLPNLAGGG